MGLPPLMGKVFDPAGAYMRRSSPRHRGPVYRGGVVYRPGVPGGARQATEDELRQWRSETPCYDWAAAFEEVRGRHGAELRRAADRVLAGERVTFVWSAGELVPYLIRFWRGDSVLEIDHRAVSGARLGISRSRPGRPGGETAEVIADYLVFAVAHQEAHEPRKA